LVDAAAPEAGEVAGEAFGIAGAGVAGGFGDEPVDPGQGLYGRPAEPQ
jgi:hypothetical protein